MVEMYLVYSFYDTQKSNYNFKAKRLGQITRLYKVHSFTNCAIMMNRWHSLFKMVKLLFSGNSTCWTLAQLYNNRLSCRPSGRTLSLSLLILLLYCVELFRVKAVLDKYEFDIKDDRDQLLDDLPITKANQYIVHQSRTCILYLSHCEFESFLSILYVL